MMVWLHSVHSALLEFIALGGWVVGLLLAVSVLAGAAILWKLWHLWALRVGTQKRLEHALTLWAQDQPERARSALQNTRNPLEKLALRGMKTNEAAPLKSRLMTEAEAQTARAETGLRLLDAIAQTAPLLGLFGTVLGMIEAFQTLQTGGAHVDPAQLAGGIWVALLTTAMGLGVAMPVSLFLSWVEGRLARQSQAAALMVETLCSPVLPPEA